jgi:hypothetical protein
MLINRFRWEDEEMARLESRRFQRVQSTLIFDGVLAVKSKGIHNLNKKQMYILMIELVVNKFGNNKFLNIMFAESGVLSLKIEYLEGFLKDVSQPFFSNLTNSPDHEI